MVIQMTAEEYEQKYGVAPAIPAAQPSAIERFSDTKLGQKAIGLGNEVIKNIKDPIGAINKITPSREATDMILPEQVRSRSYSEGEKDVLKQELVNKALAFDFTGSGSVGKKIGDIAKESFNEAISSRPGLTKVNNIKGKLIDFFSKDVDEKASTILKETPAEKLDEYVKIAEEAITDPRKLTPLEVVGDKIADATRQLQGQLKSFSEQKKQIISKAKNGLVDFTKETREAILDINRNLKDSKVGKAVMVKLRNVKNKLDADKAIDEIQDMLYKGNEDKTIPKGSSEDKYLRGVLGKLNSKLKIGLPKAYSTLNTKISNRFKVIESLNKALGEKVEGVSTRGAGLIKQFFSPSGRKAKELFDYIKENTGIDLAQDSTLAKFTMELFDDVRAKSLLEGIPTSPSGLLQTVVNALVERTGAGKKLQDALKSSTLQKAKKLTK